MNGRFLLWSAIALGAFSFIISRPHSAFERMFRPVIASGKMWSDPPAAHGSGYSNDELNNIDIYKTAHLATVNITSIVYQRGWFMQLYPAQGIGSGFFIDDTGRILTNNHVVRGSRELTVTLPNHKQYKAHVLVTDARNDLALVEIKVPAKVPFLHLGFSDNLQVGQKVLAIGNPFGLEGTLTTGIVSSLDRSLGNQEEHLEGLIQTDAAINPGNSGGPLLDSHGDVIGINTAIIGSTVGAGESGNIGIGFAMPISKAKAMLEELRTRGHVSRPAPGITALFIKGDIAVELGLPESGGLLIQRIEPGSSAEEAGLQGPNQQVIAGNYTLGIGGDLIIAIDGKGVESNDDLRRATDRKRAGDRISLTVFRRGHSRNVTLNLVEAPETL